MAQVHLSANTWREGQPGMWRPGPADRWHPTLCDGAAARGSLPTFGIHARTDACTQVGASGRWSDFRPSRNGDGAAPGWRAQSERVWESAGATAQAVFRPLVSVHTPTPASILARLQAVDGKIFDHPETMMGLRRLARTDFEKVRAGQFANVAYPVMPMLVRMLAWEVDTTDS